MRSNPSLGSGRSAASPSSKSDVDARFLRVLARHAHEGAADIDADHAAVGELGELDGEIAWAWRDFEHPIARLYSWRKPARQRPKSLHILGGLSRVPGGDEAFHADALVALGRRDGGVGRMHRGPPFKKQDRLRLRAETFLAEAWPMMDMRA